MAGDRHRLDELLLAQATEGLDAESATELERLLSDARDVDAGAYERAAAAVCLAALGPTGSLPSRVRARIEARLAQRGDDASG